MRLLVATVSIAGALLALPSAVSANGRMCMVVTEASWLDQPAWLIESSWLDPEPAQELWEQAGTAPKAGGTERILWCQSADDPRCSPVHRDSEGQLEWLRAPVRSTSPDHDDVAEPSATTMQHTSHETCALAGIRRRVERPPRS